MNIQNITKSFNGEPILRGISLQIKDGDIIYIKGANGSGKSTLLKIIAGILDADSGTVNIEPGKDIGALIENPGFIENETAEYNMRFLYDLKHKYDPEKVRYLFEEYELNISSKKTVSKYSIGMRQKLGIIQAVMEDQDILLFDEPTRGLDDTAEETFTNMIIELQKQGKQIIICAHDGVDVIPFTARYRLKHGTLTDLA